MTRVGYTQGGTTLPNILVESGGSHSVQRVKTALNRPDWPRAEYVLHKKTLFSS